MSKGSPIPGSTAVSGPIIMPATPAKQAPTAKTKRRRSRMLIPSAAVIASLFAPALTIAPTRVCDTSM